MLKITANLRFILLFTLALVSATIGFFLVVQNTRKPQPAQEKLVVQPDDVFVSPMQLEEALKQELEKKNKTEK